MGGGFASSGFEIGNVLDRRAYPAARRNRAGPPAPAGDPAGAAAVGQLPSPPQSYVFPFTIRANANTRSSTSSPQLRGPSIIRGLHFAKGGTPDGLQGIALGKSLSPVTEVNVAIATVRPYTPLFRGLSGSGSSAGAPNDATSLIDFQTTVLEPNDNLGIVVLDRDWFLVVTVAANATASPDDFSGYVTVLDQVAPDVLAFYVG